MLKLAPKSHIVNPIWTFTVKSEVTFSILGAEPLRSNPINDNKAVARVSWIFDVEWDLIPAVAEDACLIKWHFSVFPNVRGFNSYVEPT